MKILSKVLLVAGLLAPLFLFSQSGGVYISEFNLDNKAEKWCWAIGQDSDNNMLIGVANGLIVFDGLNQVRIDLPFTPLAVTYDHQNSKVWISGYGKIGILEKSGLMHYQYTDLGSFPNNEFSSIKFLNDTVYCLSDTLLVRYKESSLEKIDEISSKDEVIKLDFQLKGKMVFIIDYFLNTIDQGQFKELNSADFPVEDFAYAVSINDSNVILGTPDKNIYQFNGKSCKLIPLSNTSFFENNVALNAQLINESTIAISSLAGGIALVNLKERKVVTQVSYFNGLPDDEIRTMFLDNQKGIWVSHELGINRIDFNLNIENFNYFPGLKGSPKAVLYFKNQLYVATNDGLFYLTQLLNYNEFEVTENIPDEVPLEVPATGKQESGAVESPVAKEKQSLFSFLKKKKSDNQIQPDENNKNMTQSDFSSDKKKVAYKTEKRVIKKRSLKSVGHYFKNVPGINDKCRQLVVYNGTLLIAGNTGLYSFDGTRTKKVINGVYVTDIYYTKRTNRAYICTNDGLYYIEGKNGQFSVDHAVETTGLLVSSIAFESDMNWVITVENLAIRGTYSGRGIQIVNEAKLPQAPGQTFFVKRINDSTFVFAGNKKFYFDEKGNLELSKTFKQGDYFIYNQTGITWQHSENKWMYYASGDKEISTRQLEKLKLLYNLRYIHLSEDSSLWVINEANHIIKINKTDHGEDLALNLSIVYVKSNNELFASDKTISLTPRQKNLELQMSVPFYLMQNGVNYRYIIQGFDSDWSEWSNDPVLKIKYLPPGKYQLKIEAKNILGQHTEIKEIGLRIAKPFTQTFLFFVLLLIAVIVGGYFVFKARLRNLEKAKEILEQKVKERTKTIEEQKDKIEKQHDEITQSIRYAKRIQTAMLPHDEIMEAMLPNHFVLFMPRDIVSGDFYFFKPLGRYIVLIAADCTGHGVPGGFMSMLGISYLSEITSQLQGPTAAEIADHLREKIKLTLGQTDIDSTQKDGMDLAICLIDLDENIIQYAGAFNPLLMIRNNEIEIIKADRQPVAVYYKEADFTNHVIKTQKDDVFYIFSDGFVDQIGGPNQRKFMIKNFKELLLDVHDKPMHQQKTVLQRTINDWKGDAMQVDDILVIGFKVP